MTRPHSSAEATARHNVAGRRWAYFGLVFGAAGSVVANVAHALIRPTACLPGVPAAADPDCLPRALVEAWRPSIVAIGWGVVVAIALVVITQVLERIEWPDTTGARVVKIGGGGVVGLVAASTSYYHLSDLLLRHGGEWQPLARTGPALVDGLMALCSFALIATGSAAPATVTPARPGHGLDQAPDPDQGTADDGDGDGGQGEGVEAPGLRPPRPAPRRRPARSAASSTGAASVVLPVEVIEVGRQVVDQLQATGRPLTKRSLIDGFRDRERSLSSDRAAALLRHLRTAA